MALRTWDQSVFDRSLKRYMEVNTKRTFPEILNSKLWFIARASTWFTEKADKMRIQSTLGQFVPVNRINKKGRMVRAREVTLVKGRNDAPLAALIINKRRRDNGQRALQGPAMEKAIRKMLRARFGSVSFVKSGFLPTIRALASLVDRRGAPQMDTQTRQIGRAKGETTPARPGLNSQAKMVNLAFGNRGDAASKSRALRVGERGLRRGFDNETASMDTYIERKMKAETDRFNAGQKN